MPHTWTMSLQHNGSETRPTQTGRFRQVVTPILVMLALMWLLELLDVLLRGRLDGFGIVSRTPEGLPGIAFSPFLHGGFSHLLANTIPFVVLGLLVAWRTERSMWPVTVVIGLIGGFGVWLLGPADVVTIGASGLIFGFVTYLITAGVLRRHWLDLLIALFVVIVYGSLLWGISPFTVAPGVSWLGHLMGAIGGVVAAIAFADRSK